MPTFTLPDRALIRVHGADAETFLQSVITTDLAQLGADAVRPGALLSPQGKILFDFLISRDGDSGLRLECRADIAEALAKRLTLYRLRAKAMIATEQSQARVRWDEPDGEGWLRDERFGDRMVLRSTEPGETDAEPDAWQGLRIGAGIPESGLDYTLGDAFPHDALLDQIQGVGLRKGCYIGQEVVSRMHHRGTARRRFLIATAQAPLPAAGTAIEAGGREIGTMGSSSGSHGLALVRIDKVAAALAEGTAITCAGVALALAIPPGMAFTLPEASAPELL